MAQKWILAPRFKPHESPFYACFKVSNGRAMSVRGRRTFMLSTSAAGIARGWMLLTKPGQIVVRNPNLRVRGHCGPAQRRCRVFLATIQEKERASLTKLRFGQARENCFYRGGGKRNRG